MTSPVLLRQAIRRRYATGGVASDSVALILTSALTAATGFVFWTLAARLLTPQVLGLETAMLSLMMTTGTIAAIGVGNSFTALLPVPGCERRQRLGDGYRMIVGIALTFAVIAGVLASSTLRLSIPAAIGWTVVGTLTMAFFAVKDSAMVGLGGATRLPVQNLLASIGKLAIFPLCVLMAWHPAVVATLAASGAAAVVVIGFVIPRLLARQRPTVAELEVPVPERRDVAIFAARDGLASAMSYGVVLALPFITTAIAGPVEGAVLALALQVAQILDLISAGVGTALTAGLAVGPAQLWPRARRAWRVTAAVVLLTAVLVMAASPLIMMILGPQWSRQPVVLVLAILMVGSLVRVAFVIWAAVLRAQRRTWALLQLNGTVLSVALPMILLATWQWGAVGAAAGLSGGSVLLGVAGSVALLRGRSEE